MTAKQLIEDHIQQFKVENVELFLREVRQAARDLLEDQANGRRERWQIVQANADGTIIGFHESQADCARALNISRQAVNQALERQTIVNNQFRLFRRYAGPDQSDDEFFRQCDKVRRKYELSAEPA